MTGVVMIRYYNEIEFESICNPNQVTVQSYNQRYDPQLFDNKRYTVTGNAHYNERETCSYLVINRVQPTSADSDISQQFDMLAADDFE